MSDSAAGGIRIGTPTGRGVILAAGLGSGMAFLDGTVVTVALKRLGEDLDASLAELQWITNGYLLSLASLILLGGSLGDRFGRRRMFVVGTAWFAVASLLCGIAPNPEILIVARVLQGIGGALLTPGSLAMIQGAFVASDRPKAIGAWTGLGSVAAALGPFIGGGLVDYASWRWIFLINLPLAAATIYFAVKHVPGDPGPERLEALRRHRGHAGDARARRADLRPDPVGRPAGGVRRRGWRCWPAIGFIVAEKREPEPMLQLGIFADRTFSAANAMTLLVYAALGASLWFVTLQLQTVSGWTALEAGLASFPITICMIFLSAKGGEIGARIGPRIPMTFGPIVMAASCLLLLSIGEDVNVVTDVLPGMTLFGLGLALMVAPLTATVLAAAPDEHAGIASGVNNALARAGSLLAVAALPVAVGLGGDDYDEPAVFDDGYRMAMIACAVLLTLGGIVSWLTIRNQVLEEEGPTL